MNLYFNRDGQDKIHSANVCVFRKYLLIYLFRAFRVFRGEKGFLCVLLTIGLVPRLRDVSVVNFY